MMDARAALQDLLSCGVWSTHPQGRTLAHLPLFQTTTIGDSAPEPFGTGSRPLAGIRVLDLTRAIIGRDQRVPSAFTHRSGRPER